MSDRQLENMENIDSPRAKLSLVFSTVVIHKVTPVMGIQLIYYAGFFVEYNWGK